MQAQGRIKWLVQLVLQGVKAFYNVPCALYMGKVNFRNYMPKNIDEDVTIIAMIGYGEHAFLRSSNVQNMFFEGKRFFDTPSTSRLGRNNTI
jgi:hypothetical protein